ncbi:hypothetical protein MYCTH_2312073 [Thermothelomyces thermophilus ATCC 42464]|uniref:Uncharacterized protein n=1 Tax=Thermothelomyces thermophilus (strain ATCC 42464 / BCRC 31852 / DSM 1799) TaxID=573729 RepID=G2QQ12_THET4|nr:uncharacterized protein MYCTH_2312073 [Thermothelomyces thermophilus ATCC 42464]AEO61675.1 hypothetical protein MYCTH_2312073 [Thermothelomyces thermophilus ATCC 42464]
MSDKLIAGAGRERKTPTKVSPWDPAENPPSVQPSELLKRNLRGFSTLRTPTLESGDPFK